MSEGMCVSFLVGKMQCSWHSGKLLFQLFKQIRYWVNLLTFFYTDQPSCLDHVSLI